MIHLTSKEHLVALDFSWGVTLVVSEPGSFQED